MKGTQPKVFTPEQQRLMAIRELVAIDIELAELRKKTDLEFEALRQRSYRVRTVLEELGPFQAPAPSGGEGDAVEDDQPASLEGSRSGIRCPDRKPPDKSLPQKSGRPGIKKP